MKTRTQRNDNLDLRSYEDEIIQDIFSETEKTTTGDHCVWHFSSNKGKRRIWG